MVFLVDACPFAQHKRARQNRKNKRKNKRKRDTGADGTDESSDEDYNAGAEIDIKERSETAVRDQQESDGQQTQPEPQPDQVVEPVKEPEEQKPEEQKPEVQKPEVQKPKEIKEKKAIKDLANQDNGQTYADCMSGFDGNYIPKTYLTPKFGNTELTDYQVQLLNVLQYRRRALAWWRTGAGKTRVGVTAAADFRQKFPNGRILVIRLKTTGPAWEESMKNVLGSGKNIKFYDVSLSSKPFKQLGTLDAAVVDVNVPTMLIFDEVQKGILQGSTTTSTFFNVLDKLRQNSDNRFLALSATPFKVDSELIYVALSFLIFGTTTDSEIKELYPNGENLLKAINEFREYSSKQQKTVRGTTPEQLSVLYEAAKKSHVSTCMFNCYFEEGDAFPKFEVTQVCVPLSEQCFDVFWNTTKQYKYIEWATNKFEPPSKKTKNEEEEQTKDETYENTCFLVKSMNNSFKDNNTEFQSYKSWFRNDKVQHDKIDVKTTASLISPKMYWLALKLATEQTGRFVVFFVNTVPLAVFSKLLEAGRVPKDSIRYIVGEVNTDKRGEIKEWYNEPQEPTDKKILLLNISAGGTGLDLKWTTALYFMQMEFSPVDFYQAVGRGVRRESHGKKSSDKTVDVYVVSQQTPELKFRDARFESVKASTKKMMAMIENEQRYCIGNPQGVDGLIKTSKKWADVNVVEEVNCPP